MNESPYMLSSGNETRKFWDRDSFLVAHALLRGPVSAWRNDGLVWVPYQNCRNMRGSAIRNWRRTSATIFTDSKRHYVEHGFWFLVLALNRLYGLEMFAVENVSKSATVQNRFAHAVVKLPNGCFIDALGAHQDRKSLLRNYNRYSIEKTKAVPLLAMSLLPIGVAGICKILTEQARYFGAVDVFDVENIGQYESVKKAEIYAKIVFGEAIEDVLKDFPVPNMQPPQNVDSNGPSMRNSP